MTAVTERSLYLERPGDSHWTQGPTTVVSMAGARTAGTDKGIDVNSINRGTGALADTRRPQMWVFDVAEGAPLGDLSVVVSTEIDRGAEVRLGWTVPGKDLP